MVAAQQQIAALHDKMLPGVGVDPEAPKMGYGILTAAPPSAALAATTVMAAQRGILLRHDSSKLRMNSRARILAYPSCDCRRNQQKRRRRS